MIAGMETKIAESPEFRWIFRNTVDSIDTAFVPGTVYLTGQLTDPCLPKTATATLLRRAAREPVPHEPDMFAEHVELIRKGERHLHCVDRILDVVEPLEHVFA